MAYKCDHCGKGRETGNAVSHAKNRVKRFFHPNLQHLKVLKGNLSMRVKFCTRCIKRLRKDGRIGIYHLIQLTPKLSIEKAVQKVLHQKDKKVEKIVSPPTPALDISSIVGKKS